MWSQHHPRGEWWRRGRGRRHRSESWSDRPSHEFCPAADREAWRFTAGEGGTGRRSQRPDTPSMLLLDEVDDVLDRLEVLELVVGDLHAELVLGGDSDLDHGQRVDVEVVHEALFRGHLGGLGADDLLDDLNEAAADLLPAVGNVVYLPACFLGGF